MPTTIHQQLSMETAPRVIETEDQYEEIANRAGELVSKGRKRTPEETRFTRLLVLLIQDYDRRHALPPEASTPAERLRFLVEPSDKSATELPMPIFGQRSHEGRDVSIHRSAQETWKRLRRLQFIWSLTMASYSFHSATGRLLFDAICPPSTLFSEPHSTLHCAPRIE
jgi:hypothetical protein